MASSPKTIKAVKLELGASSTLSLDVVPDYTTELLKCQRYFYRISALENGSAICMIAVKDATDTLAILPLPVPLRAKPTLSTGGTFTTNIAGNAQTVTNISIGKWCSHSIYMVFRVSGASFVGGQSGVINASSAGNYLDFSSEF